MKTLFATALLSFSLVALSTVPAAAAPQDKALQKTVKVLVNAIKLEKDDYAAKQLDFEAMVKGLLEEQWDGLSAADQEFFVNGMEKLIREISFKAGRENFQYLDAITFTASTVKSGIAKLPSAIVINHPVKGRSELKITWVLKQNGPSWRVFDTIILGESTMEGIKMDQIELLLDEGGIARVKKAMQDKLAEVSS